MIDSKRSDYFQNNYYKNIENLCEVPNKAGSWYDWMINEGMKLDPPRDLSKILDEGDIRDIIRKVNPYLFKVYLQSQVELMTEGKRSTRILTEQRRLPEDEKYKKMEKKLMDFFTKSFSDFFEQKKEVYIVHGNGVKPNEGYCKLSIENLEELFDRSKESEKFGDLFSSISFTCVRLLIQESRETHSPSYWDKETKSITEISTNTDICLIEQNFYVALSEYTEKRLIKGYENIKKSNELKEWFKELDDADKNKRAKSFTRVSRIFSLLITSVLYSNGWIQRRPGSFDDYFLHMPVDDDTKKLTNKQLGQYRNMISFSDKLKQTIGSCEKESFDNGTEHPIFRVLRNHTHRYMYCCPEDHLYPEESLIHLLELGKTYREDIFNKRKDGPPPPGGYLNPNSESGSSVGFTVSNDKKYRKITDNLPPNHPSFQKKRFNYTKETLRSINILQKTQWEINIDFLEFITEGIKNKKVNIHSTLVTPRIEVKEMFKKSFYYRVDAGLCEDSECMELSSSSKVCQDCKRLRDNHKQENNARNNRLTWIPRILNHNANVFWHSWAFDWRGRLVVRAPILSPQKSDIDRSLIRFKEWKPLGIDGWKWFRIFLFDFFAERKSDRWSAPPKKTFSREKKCEWIDENQKELIKLIDNIENPDTITYLDLDKTTASKSITFQRISALLEYKRLIENFELEKNKLGNSSFVSDIEEQRIWNQTNSGHPIHFDASSNGYQHLSMLTNNEKIAKKVNVLSNDKKIKQDLYEEVSNKAKENWDLNDSKLKGCLSEFFKELNETQRNDIRDLVFDRSMSKLPTMTHIYGAKDYEKNFIGKNGKGKPNYFKNKIQDEHPDYHACWHNDSPIFKKMKRFDKDNNNILLGTKGLLSRDNFATKEGKRILKQSIFVDCLVEDYKKSIDEVTDNAYSELKKALVETIRIVTNDTGSKKSETPTINWKLGDGSEVWNYYAKKNSSKQLDSSSSLGILSNVIIENMSPTKANLLNYINDVLSSDFPECKIDDKFVIDAIRNYTKWVNRDKRSINLEISQLDENLYDISPEKYFPWKIYYYRNEQIKKKEIITNRIKEIGNKSGGLYGNALKRRKTCENKLIKKSNEKEEIKLKKTIKIISDLLDEKKKLNSDKQKLEKSIKKQPTIEEKKRLTEDKENENHNYWEAIYNLTKATQSRPDDILRAIEQHMFRKLEGVEDERVNNWKISCNFSIKCNFIDYSEEVDLKKVRSSVSPNFIHSLDAYHMRSSIVKFTESFRGDSTPSIWAVHDSFGTHACDIGDYVEIIKQEFLKMHREKDLTDWCISIAKHSGKELSDKERSEFKKRRKHMDFRKKLQNGDIKNGDISDFFLS